MIIRKETHSRLAPAARWTKAGHATSSTLFWALPHDSIVIVSGPRFLSFLVATALSLISRLPSSTSISVVAIITDEGLEP